MYASYTSNARNLAALRQAGWGLLISTTRARTWRPEGFHYVLDNGAWHAHRNGRAFDAAAYERLLDELGAGADWVVLPDIVEGGRASLSLSVRWLNRCAAHCKLLLIAVQDGMKERDLAPIVGPGVGIFLGGSTRWKLATMTAWGRFCDERRVHYHVARVNTVKRIAMATAAGADSMDGSSVSRYAINIRKLHNALRQPDLFAL